MRDEETASRCAEAMLKTDAASRSLGMDVSVSDAGMSTVTMTVTADMINGHDVCHGGMIFSLADSAFAFACNGYNDVTLAAAASIEFLRPAKLGDQLTAHATENHRGRRRGIYDVMIRNQRDEAVALFRGRSHGTGHPMLRNKSDT